MITVIFYVFPNMKIVISLMKGFLVYFYKIRTLVHHIYFQTTCHIVCNNMNHIVQNMIFDDRNCDLFLDNEDS